MCEKSYIRPVAESVKMKALKKVLQPIFFGGGKEIKYGMRTSVARSPSLEKSTADSPQSTDTVEITGASYLLSFSSLNHSNATFTNRKKRDWSVTNLLIAALSEIRILLSLRPFAGTAPVKKIHKPWPSIHRTWSKPPPLPTYQLINWSTMQLPPQVPLLPKLYYFAS